MSAVSAGAIGGIVGGLVIAAMGMLYGAASGRGLWALPNRIGGIVLGPRSRETEALGVSTVVGVLLHMLLSAVYGVLIVLIARNLTDAYVLTGLIVGIVIWLANYYVIGSFHAGSREVARLNPVPIALALHALFGAIAGAVARSLLP